MRTFPHPPTRLLTLCLLLVVAFLPGCKRDAAPAGPAGSAASASGAAVVDDGSVAPIDPAAAPAPDLGGFRVASVLLGDALDGEHVVRSAMREFDPRATIHASVLSTGAHPGLTLTARWHAPGGGTILETVQALAPSAASPGAPSAIATTFSLRGKAPWPAGDYVFELLADGHRLQALPFTVR
jgi:hypothetical protein